jgi:hypothetical protein
MTEGLDCLVTPGNDNVKVSQSPKLSILAFGIGYFSDQNIAHGIYAAFGFVVQHYFNLLIV